jgi:hypothetical protein
MNYKNGLYVGLNGLSVEGGSLSLGDGVVLRSASAHVMISYSVTFEGSGSAVNVSSFEVEAEFHIEDTDFDQALAKAQFVVKFLRLFGSASIGMPVVCNQPFTKPPMGPARVTQIERGADWSLKSPFSRFFLTPAIAATCASHWRKALRMTESNIKFGFAFHSADRALFHVDKLSILSAIWSALEGLFVPSMAGEIGFRLSCMIASYLEEPGQARSDLQSAVGKMYSSRSKAVHGSPEKANLLIESYDLLKRIVQKIILEDKVPAEGDLKARLFGL